MNNIIKRKWNQNSMVIIEDLQGMAFQAESGGHTFQISGIDGEGNTVALSGTPAGVMLRADGQDVTLTCSVSGGVVSATLPANAYSVPGRFGLTIFLTSDGQKTAIYAAVGTVGKTSSGTVAPPAGSDVVTMVNQINTAIAAIPANYNACFAPSYSTSGLYSVGQYVTYNGNLYRCNTAITTAETWTAAHWTQTNLGADVYDLKSAIKDINFGDYGHAFGRMNWLEWDASKDVFVDKTYIGGYVDSTGTPAQNPNLCMTKLLKIKPNTIYCVSRMNNDPAALQRATFYTEAEVFDSSIFGSGISRNARNVQYFTTPSTAGYVRLIFATADYETNFNNIKMQTGENESTVTIPVSERFINPQNANIGMTAIYQSLMTNRFWGTNDYEDSQQRLSFRVPMLTKNALEVSCKTGYSIAVNTYSKTNENTYNLINGSGWVTKNVSVPADTYFVVNLKKTDESDITVAEKINVSFSYENGTDEAIKNLIQRIDSVGVNTYYRRMFARKVWTSTGSASSTTRLAFDEIEYTDKELTLFVDSGYKVSVMYFDSEGEYISSSGWKKNTWKAEANKYFVILVAKTDDSTILLDEISALHIQYNVDSNLEKIIQNIENEIKNNKEELDDTTKELDDITKLPGEYYPQSHQAGVPKPLKLLMFGDIHADATRLSRIVNYLNTSDVDDAIALGDIIAGYFDDPFDFWGQSNADDIILVIGDHDPKDRTAQNVYDYDRVTQKGVYEKFLSPYIANWGVTYTPNKTYYYKDYADSEIRLICIDSSLRDIPAKSVTDNTEQLSWFASTLADAKAEGLTVIVACHWPISYRTLFNCSFSAITHDPNQSDSESMNTYLRPAYMEAVQTFVNGGGKFACYLTGHTHLDKVYYYRKYPNQIAFTTSCASAEDWVHATMHWDDLDRTGDAQDLFNIVTIDTNTKTMKLQRIGADRDIFGRGRHFTCIDYSLGKVIASD